MADSLKSTPRIVIAGAGISGICMAIQLCRAGFENFLIIEKSAEIGGTWLQNHYPNAGCDVPSHLYSFSFARRYDWSEKYPRQPEILQYLKDCVAKFGIRDRIQFETTIEEARFNEQECVWQITTSDGETHVANIFVSAVGQLNKPRIPNFEGLESFEGPTWHTARWNHEFDPSGRDIAIIGNGASAIQILPGLADTARSVTLFQRSAPWIHPLGNYKYPGWVRFAFRWIPFAARLHRFYMFAACDSRFIAFGKRGNDSSKYYERLLTKRMKRQASSKLYKQVMPKYPPGCKRILQSDDYLETLDRENVRLVTDPIKEFVPQGIATATETCKFDAVIFATGFNATDFLQPMQIVGRNGLSLTAAWNPRPRTLMGVMSSGFPNMFFLYGPNTNLGHNSIIFMVECQVNYFLKCLKQMLRRKAAAFEPTEAAVAAFDQKLQEKLGQTVWAGNCNSWYKTEDGSIVNNWYSTATSYWLKTRGIDFSQFQFTSAGEVSPALPVSVADDSQ